MQGVEPAWLLRDTDFHPVKRAGGKSRPWTRLGLSAQALSVHLALIARVSVVRGSNSFILPWSTLCLCKFFTEGYYEKLAEEVVTTNGSESC